MDLIDRFEDKYIPEPNSGCWIWTASCNNGGYGSFGVGNKKHMSAHRFSYTYHKGPIPIGLELDHLCRVRCCVNPDHLEPVTRRENVRRGISGEVTARRQRMKTHCPKGHPYSGANLYIRKNGGRLCKRCRADGEAKALIADPDRVRARKRKDARKHAPTRKAQQKRWRERQAPNTLG